MDTNDDFTLDDLHEDDDNLETGAATSVTEDPPVQTTPPADDSLETDDDPPAADPPKEDTPADGSDSDGEEKIVASGLELFLSQYDIEGGMITYDDGTTQHISELAPEEQAQILASVAKDARPAIEDQYDLDQTEINLLNELRTSKKSVEEYINELAQERFNAYKTETESREINYNEMSDDAVYVKFLKERNPNIKESEIEEGLSLAKDNPTYETLVNGLRDNFVKSQQQEIAAAKAKADQDANVELEQDRKAIVDAASKINEVGGFEIPREVKNDVLHDLLEVNEYGDSLFLADTFSNPETMFKTAWFSKYGEDYLADIENYYKQEITKAYKRGQAAVAQGMPGNPRSLNSGSQVEKPSSGGDNSLYDPDAAPTWDIEDLHTNTD